jgi:hypothetical protein
MNRIINPATIGVNTITLKIGKANPSAIFFPFQHILTLNPLPSGRASNSLSTRERDLG